MIRQSGTNAVSFYVDTMNKYGPPGASSNGFNENLALFSTGKCGMWIDATVAAGLLSNPDQSQVADHGGLCSRPGRVLSKWVELAVVLGFGDSSNVAIA